MFGIRCYLTSTSMHSSTESFNFVFINSWFFFRDCLDSRNFARHQLCLFFHPTSQLNYKQMFFYDQQIPHRPGATTLTLAACPWLWSVFASQLCLPVHDSLNCLCIAVPCLHPWEASNWLCLGLLYSGVWGMIQNWIAKTLGMSLTGVVGSVFLPWLRNLFMKMSIHSH